MSTPKMPVAYLEDRLKEGCLNMCPFFLAKATFQLKPFYEDIFYYIVIFWTVWMDSLSPTKLDNW